MPVDVITLKTALVILGIVFSALVISYPVSIYINNKEIEAEYKEKGRR